MTFTTLSLSSPLTVKPPSRRTVLTRGETIRASQAHGKQTTPSPATKQRQPGAHLPKALQQETIPAFELSSAVSDVTRRREIAEGMVDALLPALIEGYGQSGKNKGWETAYNRHFNEVLNRRLFSNGPESRVTVRVNFDQTQPHKRGADFKAAREWRQPKAPWFTRLLPWAQPKPFFHLGESTLETSEAPTTPEARERLKGLLKRQVHGILFEMNREYRKAHPAEFPFAIPYAPDRL